MFSGDDEATVNLPIEQDDYRFAKAPQIGEQVHLSNIHSVLIILFRT